MMSAVEEAYEATAEMEKVLTPEQVAEELIEDSKRLFEKKKKEGGNGYKYKNETQPWIEAKHNLGERAFIEARSYLALGNRDYPIFIAQRIIPELEEVIKLNPSMVLDHDINLSEYYIRNLKMCSTMAQEGFFARNGFKEMTIDQISDVPKDFKKELANILLYVVDEERFLRNPESKKGEWQFLPGRHYSEAVYLIHSIEFLAHGKYYRLVYPQRAPEGGHAVTDIKLPPEIPELRDKVVNALANYRKAERRFDDDREHESDPDLLLPDLLREKQRLEMSIAKLIVEAAVEPYLAGKPLPPKAF